MSFPSVFASLGRALCCCVCLSLPPITHATSLEAYLGYPLGEWHVRHDQVNGFLEKLAAENPRVSLETTGYSHERRRQLTAVITSPTNQARLDEILADRAMVKQGKAQPLLVIWLAYSIHGDEASGAHAALALAEQLAHSQESWITELLDSSVVLITPSQNPDGLDRFANWSNSYRGIAVPVADENHKEHNQNWPAGRYNHFLADLNRDWLFLRHPESRGRVALLHKWQPQYVGDFHEMGHNQSYFFQPGVPERTHPLTEKRNQQLTDKLANFYRQALDAKQQAYFSRQGFDDFFYGKGSTYPDINGAIGVLFEQASARGQVQDSQYGGISLAKAIDNQLTTSLAALKGAFQLRQELIGFQTDFYAGKGKPGKQGRLISTQGDRQRLLLLADLLSQHGVVYRYLAQDVKEGKQIFSSSDSLFIPTEQSQSVLVEALFERRTRFEDPTFYDVSGWDLGSAFNLVIVENFRPGANEISPDAPVFQQQAPAEDTVALLVDWQQSGAAPLLAQLHRDGIAVRASVKPFTPVASDRPFAAGTLMISTAQKQMTQETLLPYLTNLAGQFEVNLVPVSSFASATGIDLGSGDFVPLKPVKALLVSGRGTDATEVGEIWHYLDIEIKQGVTLVDSDRLARVNLERYTHLLLADGNYDHLDDALARKLSEFVEQGGVIVAQKRALTWLNKRTLLRNTVLEEGFYKQQFATTGLGYDEKDALRARQAIGGAILNWQLDPAHPLAFGIPSATVPVMKNEVLGLSDTGEPFVIAARYPQNPLVSGYLSGEYQRAFGLSNALLAEPKGRGVVVGATDNLLFRNIWLGTEKIYANALYLLPAAMSR
ncbi:M14 family zinc carboxypeptidase [Shewanella litorisediminis]|uniref:Peptidase M14 n=1 Tax=Shewanella litorisediminis TaxID=1173586 RepID=A0ABX7G351_9GAMM|nr:M14 family zinc carboxypeptidase [Shewanella litorisediminis]MCL2917241.1 peptidase M14 [Shewanella litorisediminis]QRH01714.1 peptidase M14 [Shewanella litorisediminis]